MKPRLFISCVTPEFRSLRARVAQVLQFLGYEPEFQETFGTEAGDLRQVLRDKIATCEGLVQIIGEGYGAEPPAPDADFGRVSYTQFEFLHAREQKKKTWLLFAGPGATRDTEIAGLDLTPAGLALPDGVTQEAWQAERRALQAAYRQRFEGDAHLRHPINSAAELENAVLKIRNDSEELRRQFQDWQRGLSEGQTRIESGQRRQSRVLRLLGVGVLSLLALGGALAWWLAQRAPDQIAGRVAAQVVKVQYDADEVRRKLVLEVETVYQSKLLATKAAPDWQERERLRKAAEEERAQILKDVDSLLADIAEAYRRGEASEIYQEILRILEEQGVQEALRYLGSKTATIDANVARLIASRESLTQRIRTELRPKLLGAGLAATAGEEARAEALYRDVLAADPAWPEARFRFVEFLLYTKGPRRETHATLAEAGAVYREAEEIARRLPPSPPPPRLRPRTSPNTSANSASPSTNWATSRWRRATSPEPCAPSPSPGPSPNASPTATPLMPGGSSISASPLKGWATSQSRKASSTKLWSSTPSTEKSSNASPPATPPRPRGSATSPCR